MENCRTRYQYNQSDHDAGNSRYSKDCCLDDVNLINAFQMAGFRHIVDTLWEVSDQTCVEMALDLYLFVQAETRTFLQPSSIRHSHVSVQGHRIPRICTMSGKICYCNLKYDNVLLIPQCPFSCKTLKDLAAYFVCQGGAVAAGEVQAIARLLERLVGRLSVEGALLLDGLDKTF